ncbi:hypothetical protein EI94DRAFT_1728936 [Lactarius quietus]|nr:hypothetical protein EI94DRAFT_1728936 [Lactarius quietus]
MFAVRTVQMSYRYPYNGSSFPQDSMSPTTPGGGSNASTPVNNPNPWDFDYDVATSASNPVQQPQDPSTSTGIATLHPADFSSPQEHFSASATPAVSSPTVIQLEERVPVVPSQYHRSRIRTPSGESRPRTHVQKDASSAGAEQSTCTNSGSAPSSGLVRASVTKAHAERTRAHPYRRPHSAGEGRAATHVSTAGKTPRSVSDQARASPFSEDNRSGLTRMSPPQAVPLDRSTSPPKVYSIRTDMHFNVDTNTMVAMLELPGVQQGEISVTLATEPYTHARQITIAGRSRPPFAEPAPEERERTKRERKFGEFLRRLQVPPHTQAADIEAEMKDGILVLTVRLGTPAVVEAPQVITIN